MDPAALLLRLAVVVGLLAGVVGLQATGVYDLDEPGWRLDGAGAAFEIGFALFVVVGLVLLFVGRGGDGERAPRPQRRGSGAALVALLLIVVVRLLRHLYVPKHHSAPRPPRQVLPSPTPSTVQQATHDHGHGGVLLLVVVAVVIGALALVLARRRPVVEPVAVVEEPDFQTGLVAAAASLRGTVDDPPRARVLDAYAAFETALAGRGIERGDSGTPAALLSRAVLAGSPAGPAGQLTELFGRARFSDEPINQADVTAAQVALDALLAGVT